MNARVPFVPAVIVGLLLSAPSSFAHAILMDSRPALRGTVPPGPVSITLRFNSRIDHARSRLLLLRADHSVAKPLEIVAADAPDILETRADLPAGEFIVRWQVLAVDGHITRGDVPFTVSADSTNSAAR